MQKAASSRHVQPIEEAHTAFADVGSESGARFSRSDLPDLRHGKAIEADDQPRF